MMLPRRPPGAVFEELGDGEGLVLLADERAVVLNETGLIVWHLCDGHRTVEEIAERLRTALNPTSAELDGGTVEEQVRALVELLQAQGALLCSGDKDENPAADSE